MEGMHLPHPFRDHPNVSRTVRDAFWVVALGVIGCYAFFLALGAFAPGDVAPATIVVGLLAALWVGHAWTQARIRGSEEHRDPRFVRARERRGF